jgi:peptide chain release factor 3
VTTPTNSSASSTATRTYDAVDAPTVLVEYAPELRAIESNWPKIKFHAMREHAGLMFQQRM